MNDETTYDRYAMTIEWEPEGKVLVVTVPELPGCRMHGATSEEAVKRGREALESWIDAMRFWKRPIPPARYANQTEVNRPGRRMAG
jgi:predicted RNase H-like HicB family nuclease